MTRGPATPHRQAPARAPAPQAAAPVPLQAVAEPDPALLSELLALREQYAMDQRRIAELVRVRAARGSVSE
jgi:hypothetical protein